MMNNILSEASDVVLNSHIISITINSMNTNLSSYNQRIVEFSSCLRLPYQLLA